MVQINVAAAPGGWVVRTSLIDNLLVFRTGGHAERAARQLARAALAADLAVALEIQARDGFVILRHEFVPHGETQAGGWRGMDSARPNIEDKPYAPGPIVAASTGHR